MQFGTTNAPADFQGYINSVIREALDDFASVYLNQQRLLRSWQFKERIHG